MIFTDPGYGAHFDYEGKKRDLELETAIYYVDDSLDEPIMLTDDIYKPNGIVLTPDGEGFYASDSAPPISTNPRELFAGRWRKRGAVSVIGRLL
ncbi:hypothetical protein HORIV_46340 [Vreelandella olivaria]|uniref:Uncharacterized protein n=1 Tax=Vreelandella olivaria TaxID=390919 RepID=A0ABM7GN95_9GAMM|nr:hypothetical protein HORIV_46340 [Halomonas olivaria]